ncbi:MAG: DoxX family protein [Flavobacteriaceae bacterium]|jgi:putative oxidoreductase|nr:DoxX family protein [Flavobacteriaceae bacterium]
MANINSTAYNPKLLNFGLFIFRAFVGCTMLTHGIPKMMNLFSGEKIQFMNFLGLSSEISYGLVVFAEVVCSFLLILGLFTRIALIPLIIAMLVAVGFHWNEEFKEMEPAAFYLASYILLMISGAGKISVDGMTEKKKNW